MGRMCGAWNNEKTNLVLCGNIDNSIAWVQYLYFRIKEENIKKYHRSQFDHSLLTTIPKVSRLRLDSKERDFTDADWPATCEIKSIKLGTRSFALPLKPSPNALFNCVNTSGEGHTISYIFIQIHPSTINAKESIIIIGCWKNMITVYHFSFCLKSAFAAFCYLIDISRCVHDSIAT